MDTIRVIVAGATGKTGQEIVKAVNEAPGLSLVGALGGSNAGRELGELVPGIPPGIRLFAGLEEACRREEPEVLVDFTQGRVSERLVPQAIRRGLHPVVGTTGQAPAFRGEVERLCQDRHIGAVIIANFSLGIMLLNRFAREALAYFPNLEIIEMHHETKKDRPSGTALRLAERLQEDRRKADTGPWEIPIHSVRLPGLVAHEEVLFGGLGQVLTIRHDALSRSSYGPGVVLAVRKVRSLNRVVYDLEDLLGPE